MCLFLFIFLIIGVVEILNSIDCFRIYPKLFFYNAKLPVQSTEYQFRVQGECIYIEIGYLLKLSNESAFSVNFMNNEF